MPILHYSSIIKGQSMESMSASELIKMGLGTMLITKKKVENLVNEAIKQGSVSKEQGEEFLNSLKIKAKKQKVDVEQNIQEEIHKQLKKLGLATKEDIASLRHEITTLKRKSEKK